MGNYIRWREAGATYFFTVVTYARRHIFADAAARRCLRSVFVEVRQRWPFDMFASVLLPDHLHCIWTLPEGDDDFPIRWANVKRLFTKSYLKSGGAEATVSPESRARCERGVWQPRYWEHRIRDEQELLAYRDYVHVNPVKHGYVEWPTEWLYSSVHRHLAMGWLEPEWTGLTPIRVDPVGEP